jgi:hypothetical protein
MKNRFAQIGFSFAKALQTYLGKGPEIGLRISP